VIWTAKVELDLVAEWRVLYTDNEKIEKFLEKGSGEDIE
jgi:hypothetical protein